MENTTIKINCWELKNGKEIPQLPTSTLDGFEWNGKYRLIVSNDDGSLGLPFLFATDDTAILTVETTEQEGMGTDDKKIKQVISCVPRSLGNEITCSRTRSYKGKEHVWSAWETISSASGTKVTWDASSCVDTFITAGIYNISGERLNVKDGLPIDNSNPGHTIHARLLVLNSSIASTGDVQDKCITQVLTLSNRTGGDGDVYIRTGRAQSTNMLVGGIGWEQWGKLQQNIEVGQVTSLNSFIGNGIYSGVYTDGSTFFETFVMVVINNYAVAGATGTIRRISQFKYALGIDGTFSYKTRSGYGNTGINWNDWVDLNGATTVMLQDGAVTAQKLSADVREKVENPLRPLYIAAGAEYNDTGADKTKTAPWGETVVHKAGHYYLNGLGDITEEQMSDIYRVHPSRVYGGAVLNGYVSIPVRTIFPAPINADVHSQHNVMNCRNIATSNKALEILFLSAAIDKTVCISNFSYAFYGCSKLIHIANVIDVGGINSTGGFSFAFFRCEKLNTVKLKNLKTDVSFSEAMLISKDSMLYIVQNSNPTSAITITLHPDAYTRLANDADVVAALEAQPLISLVSA